MINVNQIIVLSLFLVVSACSNHPTLGEKMLTQGSQTKQIGERWVEGNELISKGTKLIHEGEHLSKKGKAQVQKGRAMVKKGNKMTKTSEEVFHEKFPDVIIEE